MESRQSPSGGAPWGALYTNLYTVYTKCHNRRSTPVFFVYTAVHRTVHTTLRVHGMGGVHEILMGPATRQKRADTVPPRVLYTKLYTKLQPCDLQLHPI